MAMFMALAVMTTDFKASLDEVARLGKVMVSDRKEDWRTLGGLPIPDITTKRCIC